MLSAQERIGKISATVARDVLNATTNEQLLLVWERVAGIADPIEENYAMDLGTAAEPVMIKWVERDLKEPITRRQEVVFKPGKPDFYCTLDGWQASRKRTLEFKFCSPFLSDDEIFKKFYPQCAWQMFITDASEAALFIGKGTSVPFEIECVRSEKYEKEMVERCSSFLLSVKTLSPPWARPPLIPPEKWRTIDLAIDTPNWAAEMQAALVEYQETEDPAKRHEAWGKLARELVPDDVGKVIAGAFTLTRNKRGVVSIRRAA